MLLAAEHAVLHDPHLQCTSQDKNEHLNLYGAPPCMALQHLPAHPTRTGSVSLTEMATRLPGWSKGSQLSHVNAFEMAAPLNAMPCTPRCCNTGP